MKIEDYAFLSDTETAALLGRDGSVDWLCFPRFDSGACFCKLLGDEKNGYWKIAPTGEVTRNERRYRSGTLVLDTEIETREGRVKQTDFLPIRDDFPDLVRIVEGVEGEVEMRMDLVIRFDYGTSVPWVRAVDRGLIAISGPNGLLFQSDVETHGEDHSTAATFTVKPGQKVAFVLTWFPSRKDAPKPTCSEEALVRTENYWREWSGHCESAGRWSEAVKSSLLALKGLTFGPSGGIVAAATTSLPEQLGGMRNWDYRFCWVRDATFTLNALLSAGYTEEAIAWRNWLLRAVAGSPSQMQVLYGVCGEKDLREYELPHLAGYEGSKPVRIGNAAADQFQLDIYGEVMDAMERSREAGIEPDDWSWEVQKHLVDFVIKNWQEPDDGIWEVRGGRRHFTHSRVMAWVALDRAVSGVEKYGLDGDVERWREVRAAIHQEVCARGYNEKKRAFTQSFESDELDASVLLLPIVGFLPPEDPRVISTVEAIERELLVDGYVLRYRTDSPLNVDGLEPGEGAFLPCTFWLVDCLAMMGRKEEALELFEKLLALRNDLGLIAEEYDPHAKRMVGNFPQAFTHVALVNSAAALGMLD